MPTTYAGGLVKKTRRRRVLPRNFRKELNNPDALFETLSIDQIKKIKKTIMRKQMQLSKKVQNSGKENKPCCGKFKHQLESYKKSPFFQRSSADSTFEKLLKRTPLQPLQPVNWERNSSQSIISSSGSSVRLGFTHRYFTRSQALGSLDSNYGSGNSEWSLLFHSPKKNVSVDCVPNTPLATTENTRGKFFLKRQNVGNVGTISRNKLSNQLPDVAGFPKAQVTSTPMEVCAFERERFSVSPLNSGKENYFLRSNLKEHTPLDDLRIDNQRTENISGPAAKTLIEVVYVGEIGKSTKLSGETSGERNVSINITNKSQEGDESVIIIENSEVCEQKNACESFENVSSGDTLDFDTFNSVFSVTPDSAALGCVENLPESSSRNSFVDEGCGFPRTEKNDVTVPKDVEEPYEISSSYFSSYALSEKDGWTETGHSEQVSNKLMSPDVAAAAGSSSLSPVPPDIPVAAGSLSPVPPDILVAVESSLSPASPDVPVAAESPSLSPAPPGIPAAVESSSLSPVPPDVPVAAESSSLSPAPPDVPVAAESSFISPVPPDVPAAAESPSLSPVPPDVPVAAESPSLSPAPPGIPAAVESSSLSQAPPDILVAAESSSLSLVPPDVPMAAESSLSPAQPDLPVTAESSLSPVPPYVPAAAEFSSRLSMLPDVPVAAESILSPVPPAVPVAARSSLSPAPPDVPAISGSSSQCTRSSENSCVGRISLLGGEQQYCTTLSLPSSPSSTEISRKSGIASSSGDGFILPEFSGFANLHDTALLMPAAGFLGFVSPSAELHYHDRFTFPRLIKSDGKSRELCTPKRRRNRQSHYVVVQDLQPGCRKNRYSGFRSVYGSCPVDATENCPQPSESDLGVSDTSTISVEHWNRSVEQMTARDVVLQKCGQEAPITFSKAFSRAFLNKCKKIGEGVYGEVFLCEENGSGRKSVLKIIPIEGEEQVNGAVQKKYAEILSEIVIAMELSDLRNGTANATTAFSEVLRCLCVQGQYPKKLIELWNRYAKKKTTENDSPTMFGEDQLFVILELGHAGTDLEAYVFSSAHQGLSVFQQVTCGLAVAELVLKFEHRDLHWGNVLVSATDDETVSFRMHGKEILVETKGVKVTIIDFTLSRMTFEDCQIFNDLSLDPELFVPLEKCTDYQFEIYSLMRVAVEDDWKRFVPKTNIYWLHYLADKLIKMARYLRTRTRVHSRAKIQLQHLFDCCLLYDSSAEFLDTCLDT